MARYGQHSGKDATQESQRKEASEGYSATGQQRDRQRSAHAAAHVSRPAKGGGKPANPTQPPDEIPQQDDRPERYPVEDATRQDARVHHRP